MYTKDVIAHFRTRADIARELQISRAAVSKWGKVVPEGSAYKLESITRGRLKVIPSLYKQRLAESSLASA